MDEHQEKIIAAINQMTSKLGISAKEAMELMNIPQDEQTKLLIILLDQS